MNKKKVIRNLIIVGCVIALLVSLHFLGAGEQIIELIKKMHGIK